MKVALFGAATVKSKLRRLPREVTEAAHEALGEGAYDLAAYIQGSKLSGQVLKVRTGTLRRSINAVQTGFLGRWVVAIGAEAWYGELHEFGKGGMPKRPFMRPSLKEKRQEITDRVNRAIEAYLERLESES